MEMFSATIDIFKGQTSVIEEIVHGQASINEKFSSINEKFITGDQKIIKEIERLDAQIKSLEKPKGRAK